MDKKKNKLSLSFFANLTVAVFLIIAPFVFAQFFSINPLIDSMVYLAFWGISTLFFRKCFRVLDDIFTTPGNMQTLELSIPVRTLLLLVALSIPAIAGYFLQFNYILAFIVSAVAFIPATIALDPWLDKLKTDKSETYLGWVLLAIFSSFFISFSIFSGYFLS